MDNDKKKEMRYIIAGYLLMLAGCVMGFIFSSPRTIPSIVSGVAVCFGMWCVLTGLWKRRKRINSLPPPSDVRQIDPKIFEYLSKPESERWVEPSPHFEESRMDNEKKEAEFRRLEAESHARVDAVFEKNRQEYIAQMEADAKREIDNILLSPPPGRWYHLAGSMLFLGGLGGTVAPGLGAPIVFRYIGPVMIVLGVVCWLLSSWKQDKQRNKLPPPQ